jgi:hypothetical protein
MPLKINQAFVQGFAYDGDSKLRAPLTVTGDDDELILRKGAGFDEWLKDATKIQLRDGTETTYTEENQKTLQAIVRGWLYGMEYEG